MNREDGRMRLRIRKAQTARSYRATSTRHGVLKLNQSLQSYNYVLVRGVGAGDVLTPHRQVFDGHFISSENRYPPALIIITARATSRGRGPLLRYYLTVIVLAISKVFQTAPVTLTVSQ